MSVYCRQVHDGVEAGERVIDHHYDGQTDRELLEVKFNSHGSRGWTVTKISDTEFVATKAYLDVADKPDRVDRYFTIREG